jgi:hypothetical protein
MKHHKYDSKYDPKHNAKQPALARASVEVSATAPTVVRIQDAVPADKSGLDARIGSLGPVAPIVNAKPVEMAAVPALGMQAAAPVDAKSSDAMVNEGGPVPITAVPGKVETGDKVPALSAKPLA